MFMDATNDARRKIMLDILKKKELRGIKESVVHEILVQELRKNNIAKVPLAALSEKDRKILVKSVRAGLRKIVGRFHRDIKNEKKDFSEEEIRNIINSHSSTKERKEEYSMIMLLLEELKVQSILDVGCGINPLAMASPDRTYYALDIDGEALRIVEKFFEKKSISGRTILADIKNVEEKEIPSADICFLFKVLDILDMKGHKNAEAVLKKLPCKYVLVSFSMKTLSGRAMSHPQRGWIEQLCNRLGYSWKLIKSKNEIFYLISK